jgi:hypothetical protein
MIVTVLHRSKINGGYRAEMPARSISINARRAARG